MLQTQSQVHDMKHYIGLHPHLRLHILNMKTFIFHVVDVAYIFDRKVNRLYCYVYLQNVMAKVGLYGK